MTADEDERVMNFANKCPEDTLAFFLDEKTSEINHLPVVFASFFLWKI